MMKKLLTATVFAAMTASVNAETVATPVTAGVSEQDIEQVKILVAECQKAGLSQKETIQFVAEQIEKKVVADDENMSSMTKGLFIVGTMAALVAIAVIAYKNWPSEKENNGKPPTTINPNQEPGGNKPPVQPRHPFSRPNNIMNHMPVPNTEMNYPPGVK